MAGAPLGNKNGVKENRLWSDAIKRAVAQGNGKKLRQIADKLIDMAADGDIQAMKELGDRIDGKAVQQISGAGANGEHKVVHKVEFAIIDATN